MTMQRRLDLDQCPAGIATLPSIQDQRSGRAEPVSVFDTMGVHPEFRHIEVASAMLSQLSMNLAALNFERVRSIVPWGNFDFLQFMAKRGFAPSQRLSFRRPIV